MEDTNMGVKFGVSEKGKRTAIYKGFEFWQKYVKINGAVNWRCSKFQLLHCKAVLQTLHGDVIGNKEPEHCHEGNHSTILAKQAIAHMKRLVVESGQLPSSAIATASEELLPHVMMALPSRDYLARTLRRTRQTKQIKDTRVLPPIPSDTSFAIPECFREFVLYDSVESANRIIVMGCRQLLEGLSRAAVWLADGTFKICPTLFLQLYTVHFQFVDGIAPAAFYCLLPDKTRQTYDRLVNVMHNLLPQANPQLILLDFEMAAMGAFRAGYADARIRGCYFHLSQSVLRRVQAEGLKAQYENDDALRGFIRSLIAISHVPVEDVTYAFDALIAEAPTEYAQLDHVITYLSIHMYEEGDNAEEVRITENPFSPMKHGTTVKVLQQE